VAYNFQTGNNKIKLRMEYENVTEKVLFDNAVLAALMSGRKYDVIPQNGDCSRESNVHTLVFQTKSVIKMECRCRTQYGKDPNSDNAIRRLLKAVSRDW
jgi:hypothetical protein